jgi:hypothetical protein
MLKVDENGYERKVNNPYLIDAVSFTDAETRIFEKMQELTSGEFQVVNIKPSNITEVLGGEGEWYYKAKISLVAIDEHAGREKKINQYILIPADDLKQAIVNLEEGLSYMLIPYDTTAIQLSGICEVFDYDLEKAAQELTD